MNFTLIPARTVAAGLLLVMSLRAETVIYRDDFNGTGQLHGRTPTVTTGANNWTARSSLSMSGGALTNGVNAAVAYLPFIPETGHVYVLTAAIKSTGVATGATYEPWNSLGFAMAANPSLTANFANTGVNGIGSIYFSAPAGFRWYEGPNTGGITTPFALVTSVTGQPFDPNKYYEYKLVLDTTPAQWTMDFFIEGTQIDLNGVATGKTHTWAANPTIRTVLLSSSSAVSGMGYDSFSLVADPDPVTSLEVAFTDTTALPGVIYVYRVRALSPAGSSSWATVSSHVHDGAFLIEGAVRASPDSAYDLRPGAAGFGPLSLKHSENETVMAGGHTMTATRNDQDGWFGMALRTGDSAVEVRELGRWVAEGNTQTHEVRIVDAATHTTLGAVPVPTADATPGEFKFVPLTTPVFLASNSRYFLLSEEFAGGDYWYDPGTRSPGTATGYQQWLLAGNLPMDASGTGAATATVNGALPNLVKYALGLPAAATHHEGKLQHGHGADSDGSYLTFSFTHPEPPPPEVAYSVEASGTLEGTSWSTANVQLLDSTVQDGLRTVKVRVDPAPGAEKVFARLKVSFQP